MLKSRVKSVLYWVIVVQTAFLIHCRSSQPTEPEELPTEAVFETEAGEVRLELLTREAPLQVRLFSQLCRSGFYDGTYFHRVSPDYLVQGGDPNTRDGDRSNDGLGGSLEMEWQPPVEEVAPRRGSLAMVKGMDDRAGSQFFVLLTDVSSLGQGEAVFGRVSRGLDILEGMAEVPGTVFPEKGGVNPEEEQYLLRCRIPEKEPSGPASGEE